MKIKVRTNSVTIFLMLLFCIVIFMGWGNKTLYLVSGVVLMGSGVLVFLKRKDFREYQKVYRAIIFWAVYQIIICLFSISFDAVYVIFQHIGILAFFWMIVNSDLFGFKIENIASLFKIIHYLLLIFMVTLYIINPNSLARYESNVYIALSALVFACMKKENISYPKLIIFAFVWTYISYATGARAQCLSFVLFAICTVFLLKVQISKKIINRIFVIYYIVLNLFPIFYVWLSTSVYAVRLNELALQLTNSRFFSGRNILWQNVYRQITDWGKVFFGIGVDTTAEMVRSNISLHNLYITLLAEGGIILIVIMGIILYQIWVILNKSQSQFSKVSMAFLVAVLYKQCFDISLVENNLWVAFAVWMILGIGLNLYKYEKV